MCVCGGRGGGRGERVNEEGRRQKMNRKNGPVDKDRG